MTLMLLAANAAGCMPHAPNLLFCKITKMEQCTFKNVNNCLNTNIYSYIETSGGEISSLYLNVVYFFDTSVNLTSVAAYGTCFPALVSNMCCSITAVKGFLVLATLLLKHSATL
jgi:hypothetical protein